MSFQAGYLIDVSSIKLDDTTNKSWIQVIPRGKWEHPDHGTLDFLADTRLQRFADNIKNNVRGQKLNLDYDHIPGVASGWYTGSAETRQDGVWAEVEWTPKAVEH